MAREPELSHEIKFQNVIKSSSLSPDFSGKLPTASLHRETVILATPDDPYYSLAEEISQKETLTVINSLEDVMDWNPMFLLWVVSPSHLSDQVIVDFSLSMRNRQSAISVGIISGTTLEQARGLWQRASQVKGRRVFAVNGKYPSARVFEGRIIAFDGSLTTAQPLTKTNLIYSLQDADYLTFTGHGGWSFLELDESAMLRPADIPELPPIVIATASCNNFRIWEPNSIVLDFASKGAAAYAGFAYSPNEGYLIGEFDDLPFRYTWPDFPIGHVVQVQNHGTLQGFAHFPYYYLLGDPRISLQDEMPYRLVDDHKKAKIRTLKYVGAPAGFIPVHIPGGAKYNFVEIRGVTASWIRDQFYNSRLQMVNIQDDKYVLFAHEGGDFTLRLQIHPSWQWIAVDVLTDALDHGILFSPQHGGDIFSLFFAGAALIGVVFLIRRRRNTVRPLLFAIITGLGFAAVQGWYAFTRLDQVSITSKPVTFSLLFLVGTFFLTGCGAILFFIAKSWRAKVVSICVAVSPTLAGSVFTLGGISVANTFLFKPKLGTSLYNYSLGLLNFYALLFEITLIGLVFFVLNRLIQRTEQGEE